jgi:hypothetical protein
LHTAPNFVQPMALKGARMQVLPSSDFCRTTGERYANSLLNGVVVRGCAFHDFRWPLVFYVL